LTTKGGKGKALWVWKKKKRKKSVAGIPTKSRLSTPIWRTAAKKRGVSQKKREEKKEEDHTSKKRGSRDQTMVSVVIKKGSVYKHDDHQ